MNQIEAKKQKIEYFSYVIGLIAFMVLGTLIGNNGITYMAVIIECVSLFVILAGGEGAELIGRLIRTRRKKNQYKEAAQLHRAYFLIQCISAVVLMIIYFFLTDVFANIVFRMPYLAIAMKLLTPVILLKTLQSVMSGYFQGMGAHMPAVVCAVFRQLLFLLFGLLLTGRMLSYGEKVSALLNNTDYAGMYGTVGLCLAILISEILITLFLFIVYIGSDRKKEKQKTEDGFQRMESVSERIRLIVLVTLPETMKSILKKFPFSLCLFIVLWNASNISSTAHEFGVFYGYFICVCAVPIFAIAARIVHITNTLTILVKRKDARNIRAVLYAGLHYCWTIGLYISVCMAVLAPQIGKVLHKDQADMLVKYYTQGAVIVVVLVMSIFIWKALYALGSGKMIYMSLSIFNIIFVLSSVILRSREMDALMVISLSALVASVVQLIISFIYIVRKFVLQPDLVREIVIPVAASGAMGIVVMLIRNLLAPHVSSFMCLLLCLAFSIIIYMAVLVFTRSIYESEVKHVYGALGQKIFGVIIR